MRPECQFRIVLKRNQGSCFPPRPQELPLSPQDFPQDKKLLALALLALAQFVVVLDASIVNVALPVDRP